MKLSDAIKSGMPYRSPSTTPDHWHKPGAFYTFSTHQILVEDWEIKPEAMVSSSQFWEACRKVSITVRDVRGYKDVSLFEFFSMTDRLTTDPSPLLLLARELGLEPK